ncbi:MAG TPA: LysR family transcriptional regulator [Steroidobacteraceae bacterium]|nr:LysR family transcriptional regulator [Steroidobacteraceae bacterium]
MQFDFRDLEHFIAVAETGSIARAAERCHTVASAVSRRLSDLEASFGTPLLVRGAKGVALTPAGHAFLARARGVLHQAEQLDDEMRRHASGARGHVRVFANISAIVEFLPAALASFLAKYPDIHIHLEEHVSSSVAAAVADNLADFGILGELVTVEGLTLRPFRNDELVVVLKPDHPLASRGALAFSDIVPEPLIGLHDNSSLHQLLARAAAELGRPLNVLIRVTSFDAVCAMVAAGLGISVIPKAAASAYSAQLHLATAALDEGWARRQLQICTRTNEPLHGAAQQLLDHLLGHGTS